MLTAGASKPVLGAPRLTGKKKLKASVLIVYKFVKTLKLKHKLFSFFTKQRFNDGPAGL